MTMTQRYAGMLRRHAAEWDKQGMPVQGEAARQAARHMEELQNRLTLALDLYGAECGYLDLLLGMLGLDPEQFRAEDGRPNLASVRTALADTDREQWERVRATWQ